MARIRRTLAELVDLIAWSLGSWYLYWLRGILYVFLALLAGVVLGQPALVGGSVLGVYVIASLIEAILETSIDPRPLLVRLYIAIWWPLRGQVGNRSPLERGGELPTHSKEEALAWLLYQAGIQDD